MSRIPLRSMPTMPPAASRLIPCLTGCLIAIAIQFATVGQLDGQEASETGVPDRFQRQIFVPFESLDVLLDGNSNRVLLTRDEYEALLKSARAREIKQAPFDSAVVDAKYEGKILDGVAQISAELIVEPLNEGLVQIPLPFSGVAIRTATIGGRPANLWRNAQGQIVLLLSGQRRETLKLELTVPLQTTAARQTLSIQLPSPSATQFNLSVPGNVEVKSGATVANRTYDQATNTTRFDLLGTREAMNIVMSLNNRLLKDDQVIVARSVSIHKLSPNQQELHLTCSLDVIHGALEEIEFDVPKGFQVSHVATELLNQWELVQPTPPTSGEQRLKIKLRQPSREDLVVNMIATRDEGVLGPWTAADIRPIGVVGNVSVVGVLADIQLESSKLQSDGLIPIDHEFLFAALPASLQTSRLENPVAVVAAFYAPQKEYLLSADFVVPKPELIVKSNSRLVINDQQLELQGGLALTSRHDFRFDFRLRLPTGWRLNEITDEDGKPVQFDRLGGGLEEEFFVHLSSRIPDNSAKKLFYKASLTPQGWLDRWETNRVAFPVVKVADETRHTGAIAIATEEDLELKPNGITALELLDEQDKQKFELDQINAPLAYQFDSTDYQLNLDLERRKPSLIARTYNYYTIKPSQLVVHSELIYDVKQAGEDEFVFELPLDSPRSVSIAAAGLRMKDSQSEETDSARRWTVQLARPQKGLVHLLVDYQQPIEESDLKELKLSPVLAQGVNFQSSMFAIEGSAELDIEISTTARAVDVGELSEAFYQPGRYTLGAWSSPTSALNLTVNCLRRAVFPLPSAIVQRAEMVTAISTDGKSQTAARFQLVTKQQPFLRIELPAEAKLWSVQLDGQPAKPQRQNDALLISLIGNETGKLRDLQLVFESPATAFKFVGQVKAHAPALWLNESVEGQGQPVPLVDLHWRLILPDGFSVSHGDGNFQSEQLIQQPSPIQQLGHWIYQLGGGIGRFGLVMLPMAKLSEATSLAVPDAAVADFEAGEIEEELTAELDRMARAPAKKPEALMKAKEKKDVAAEPARDEDKPAVDDSMAPAAPREQKREVAGKDKTVLWALSGLRSLAIELTDTGNSIAFYNLGEQPTLTVTVVNQSRINWMAILVALLIAALGVLLTNGKLQTKVFFLLLVLVLACLVPLAGQAFDAFESIVELALLTAVFLAIYFVVAWAFRLFRKSVSTIVTRIPMLIGIVAISVCFASPAAGQEVVNDLEGLRKLIVELQAEPNVRLPEDALIIPFDPEDPQGRENANRLLLPYEHYLKLINRAEAGNQIKPPVSPVDYVLSSAEYNLKLTLEEALAIRGKLAIELLTDQPVAVNLPIDGGALADAKVDGKPAKLQFLTVESGARQQKSQSAAASNVVQLHLEGRGTKVFEFTVQMKPQRQGGWRMLDARLPVGMTRGLTLDSLDEPTEIRLNADADRRSIEAKPNQQVATVLNADGTLRLQWKPSTAAQAVDQSLTATSEAIFDVREDGLRLTWRVTLDFRGTERDVFTLNLPGGFLVEAVNGENVRSWDVKQNDDQTNRLNVTMLSAAKEQETFTIELSDRGFSVTDKARPLDAPFLTVEGAALHQGYYSIRQSPIVELQTGKQRAVSRIDQSQFEPQIDVASLDEQSSPLGIKPFQVLQFVATPFQIGLTANLVPRTLKVETQSIVRIGQSEADLEMRFRFGVGQRPIYKLSFDVPRSMEIRKLVAGLKETWTSEPLDESQRIHVYFPDGVADDFLVLMEATPTDFVGGAQWSLPSIRVNDVTEQSGQMAIQVDPAISVSTGTLQNCESVLLQQIESWLNPEQRTTTRLVLRTTGGNYEAELKFTRIQPRVLVQTVTNVRTTLFAIEETMLLDFDIQQAGIREVQFELPVSMRNARVIAKLVSEKNVDEIADNQNAVRVTLRLQDDVIGSYRVVVENDRQLSDARQIVPIPHVLTGTTQERYATLQNAGRDEIEVLESNDFQALNRQLKQFAKLKQTLSGGELTMAYLDTSNTDWPSLRYEMKQRESLETVAASIEFSKTTMIVDSSGAYRALQNFQVNNRSEQYLEVELPDGATLLTVVVSGQPVKPVAWPAASNDRRLRIPLVKTPLGDLDYPVQLKYAGQLGPLANFQDIQFPVIETLNINVQLSQLHLRLPETHRWINFDGTMTKVDSRGELEEGFLSYKARQIQQLTQQLQSKSSKLGTVFSKSRALKNLEQLERDMRDYQTANREFQSDEGQQVAELIVGNQAAIREAQQQYSLELGETVKFDVDNRTNFNELVAGQSVKLARNSVTRQGSNFATPQVLAVQQDAENLSQIQVELSQQQGQKAQNFDGKWFARNKLNSMPQPESQSGERAANEPTQAPNRPAIVDSPQRGLDAGISFANPAEKWIAPETNSATESGLGQSLAGQMGRSDRAENDVARYRTGGGMGGDGAMGDYQLNTERSQGLVNGPGGPGGLGTESLSRGEVAGSGGEPTGETRSALQLGAGMRQNGDPAAQFDSYLGSLDIELPARGVDFYFKSPRGKATVTARPIEFRSVSRWTSALITLGVCVGVWVLCWLALWLQNVTTIRMIATVGMLLAGLVSVATAFFPIYGLVALLAAFVLIVDWATRSAWSETATEA